ncbi:site-2 protease family protein [Salinibacillus kushneri]|uniref:site-2 protease family protein n=1 Tax=Salinibacillus kushneri TaxID=237682 RepID=UPI000B837CEE|nr:site-2 protease family protein [Salinibacillus kushneri]
MEAKAKANKSIWGWLTVVGLFLLSKLKWVVGIFKIGKFATLGSMFVSLGGYAMVFGWKFALAIVYLIFVHEMGHLAAAKMKGIPTSPAIFLPFVGAIIGIDPKNIKNAKQEFFIAYGGPLAGLLSILPAGLLYLFTSDPYWGLVIELGALINLFNLFPVSPLDGGRIVTVLSTKIWLIGLLILVPIIFISPDPILFLILIFGAITWWHRYQEKDKTKLLSSEQTFLTELENERKAMLQIEERGNRIIMLKNHLLYKHRKLQSYLQQHTNTSKNKIEIKQAKLKEEWVQKTMNKLDFYEEEDYPVFQDLAETYQTRLKELDEELDRLQTYYETSLKTKVISLLLYLGLILFLVVFLLLGMAILEYNQHLIL